MTPRRKASPRHPPGKRIKAWVQPLHDGPAFGLTGRILAALADETDRAPAALNGPRPADQSALPVR
jgi:hypothetical protein